MLNKLTLNEVEAYGNTLLSKLDTNNYKIESSLLVEFMKVSRQVVNITIANQISSLSFTVQMNVQAPISGVRFLPFPPPVANKTANISINIDQVFLSVSK